MVIALMAEILRERPARGKQIASQFREPRLRRMRRAILLGTRQAAGYVHEVAAASANGGALP
jgi:hypothetical protein